MIIEYLCPKCGKVVCKTDGNPKSGVYVWCKKCKKEVEVKTSGEIKDLRTGSTSSNLIKQR